MRRRRSTRSTSRPNSGPSYVYVDVRKRSTRRSKNFSAKPASRLARLAGKGAKEGSQEEEGEEGKKKKKKPKREQAAYREAPQPPGKRRPGAGRRSRSRRGQDGRPQGRRRLSRLLPDAAALEGATYVESDRYEHIVNPRVYHLQGRGRQCATEAYRMVAVYTNSNTATHYFRRAGDPRLGRPADPRDTRAKPRTIHGREYDIYVDGGRIRLIAWHRGEDTYWVSNSLQQSLTNDQMVGIARSANVILPKQSTTAKQGRKQDELQTRAGRSDRGRLGGPGDRCLLRRARPPGDRARHPAREGGGALARRDDDPRARPHRDAAAQPRADHLHHRHGGAARRRPLALHLRRHAADLLRRRRPLAGALGGRRAARRGPTMSW